MPARQLLVGRRLSLPVLAMHVWLLSAVCGPRLHTCTRACAEHQSLDTGFVVPRGKLLYLHAAEVWLWRCVSAATPGYPDTSVAPSSLSTLHPFPPPPPLLSTPYFPPSSCFLPPGSLRHHPPLSPRHHPPHPFLSPSVPTLSGQNAAT